MKTLQTIHFWKPLIKTHLSTYGDPMVVVTTNVMHDYVVSRYRFSTGCSHLNLAKFRWTFSRYAHNFCVGLDCEEYESSNRIYVQRRSGWC